MGPSQLTKLKKSLREQGITTPKSIKQRKQGLSTEAKAKRSSALQSIRESLNPFDSRLPARRPKRDIIRSEVVFGKDAKVSKAKKNVRDERNREAVLAVWRNRTKVGGITDNRIGEDDLGMTAEERSFKRFATERKKQKKGKVFDLEGPEEDLTHGGRALDFHGAEDDYDAASVAESEESESSAHNRKRRFEDLLNGGDLAGEDEVPERKKSKAEVMEEVIKKSKLFKYERQAAKEEDYEARKELDKNLPDIREALGAFALAVEKRNKLPAPMKEGAPVMHPDRLSLINGVSTKHAEEVYDKSIKVLAKDGRAKPADRTKTEEEIEQEEAERIKKREEERAKRNLGVDDSSEDEGDVHVEVFNDAKAFGLKNIRHTRPEGIDDEDDFLIDDNLVDMESTSEAEEDAIVPEVEEESEDELLAAKSTASNGINGKANSCPQNLSEIRALLSAIPYENYHETIRQIRISNDPALSQKNCETTAAFAVALVEYLPFMPTQTPPAPSETMDFIIRHIHSLARKFPEEIGQAFRTHLTLMHDEESMTPGEIVVLTALGSVFAVDELFHPIVIPALLLMASHLSREAKKMIEETSQHANPNGKKAKPKVNEAALIKGAYLVRLCLKYLAPAKRYMPELVRFTLTVLEKVPIPRLLDAHFSNLDRMTALWSDLPAFPAIFHGSTLFPTLRRAGAPSSLVDGLARRLAHADALRQPLALHSHRPLAIKTFVPRFEVDFSASKHYDPDPLRAESARLRKDYKNEKKSALRELRKDSRVLGAEKLREKRERDRAYEEKYKRLVAGIQGEEGREANEYDREKKRRKRQRG